MTTPDDWQHLKPFGYAPGHYMGKCHCCKQIVFDLDKRAVTCRPCAEEAYKTRKAKTMNRQEHLLTIAAEECNEIAHRISKALRFGLQEVQKTHSRTNAYRIMEEYAQLKAMIELLQKEGALPVLDADEAREIMVNKIFSVEHHLKYSRYTGCLSE